jgi:nicotinate-nucleotide pyrophosphorylase
VSADLRARGQLVAREELVVAGLQATGMVFEQISAGGAQVAARVEDKVSGNVTVSPDAPSLPRARRWLS